jgi:Kef-type K+ transport system membrane component KefB
MSGNELFLVAMGVILGVPWMLWRLGRTDHYAPLVVVQIIAGILLGPGVLGAVFPSAYNGLFTPAVVQSLNGVGTWAVICFVWLAGLELDLPGAWQRRRESGITAGLALGMPLLTGGMAALLIVGHKGWIGDAAQPWQFVLGIGMACAVTALPILILFMERLEILRRPLGQRILRYASLDDVAIWGVLAIILLDWHRIGRQLLFLVLFVALAMVFRRVMNRLTERDRWYVALIWLVACAFGADWSGLHFMVGAFLAGAFLDAKWFNVAQRDALRQHVLLLLMPVFFLNTGLRTHWSVGGLAVFAVAALFLVASTAGKLLGLHAAGRILRWQPGEASLIGWLLQTKALIMIIFANVLLDRQVITAETFTALLLMAVASTMLTIPVVTPLLKRSPLLLGRDQ